MSDEINRINPTVVEGAEDIHGAETFDADYSPLNRPAFSWRDNMAQSRRTLDKKQVGDMMKMRRMGKGMFDAQGYNDKLDESMGMSNRESSMKQSMKDRRDESKGMEKGMGRRAYQRVGTMDAEGIGSILGNVIPEPHFVGFEEIQREKMKNQNTKDAEGGSKCEGKKLKDSGYCDLDFDYSSSGLYAKCSDCENEEFQYEYWDSQRISYTEPDEGQVLCAVKQGGSEDDLGYCSFDWGWGSGYAYADCDVCGTEVEATFDNQFYDDDDDEDFDAEGFEAEDEWVGGENEEQIYWSHPSGYQVIQNKRDGLIFIVDGKIRYKGGGYSNIDEAISNAEIMISKRAEGFGAEDDTFICKRSGKTEYMDNGFLVPGVGMVSDNHMTKEDWRAWNKHNAQNNPDSYSKEELEELGLGAEGEHGCGNCGSALVMNAEGEHGCGCGTKMKAEETMLGSIGEGNDFGQMEAETFEARSRRKSPIRYKLFQDPSFREKLSFGPSNPSYGGYIGYEVNPYAGEAVGLNLGYYSYGRNIKTGEQWEQWAKGQMTPEQFEEFETGVEDGMDISPDKDYSDYDGGLVCGCGATATIEIDKGNVHTCPYCFGVMVGKAKVEIPIIEEAISENMGAEEFGAERRYRYGNRYITRDSKGRFKKNVDVGRSLSADRRRKAKTVKGVGQGGSGDYGAEETMLGSIGEGNDFGQMEAEEDYYTRDATFVCPESDCGCRGCYGCMGEDENPNCRCCGYVFKDGPTGMGEHTTYQCSCGVRACDGCIGEDDPTCPSCGIVFVHTTGPFDEQGNYIGSAEGDVVDLTQGVLAKGGVRVGGMTASAIVLAIAGLSGYYYARR